MTETIKKMLICSVLAVSAAAFFIAEAQSAESKLETMIVTANKMEENVQNIPETITVLDGEMLEERGIRNLNELMKQIPNLYSEKTVASANAMNFRGLQTSVFTRTNPVVLYIDGIPQSNSYGYEASLVDVERVEILRGSQGTIYGKDTIGGVINIITKKPTNHVEGFVRGEYATDNYMLGTFSLHTPIVKNNLYMSINGQFSKDNGWITNQHPGLDKDANSEKEHNVSSTLLYEPTEKLSVRLYVGNESFRKNWFDGMYLDPSRDIRSATRDEAENTDYDIDTYTKIKGNSQALNVIYRFANMNLTSLTTHKKLNLNANIDYDFGNNPVFDGCAMYQDASFDTISQELRFSSTNHDGIRWVGGLYAERDKTENPRYGTEFPLGPGLIGDAYTESELTSDTAAIFAQAIIPFADKFELTLGARYQHLKREIDARTDFTPDGVMGAPDFDFDAEVSWDAFLPKLALLCKLDNTLSIFANISRGYMPGGYNLFIMTPKEDTVRFEAQTSMNYEIGTKKVFNDGYMDLTLFYLDIRDVHTYKMVQGFALTSNIPRAHSWGAETEFGYFFNENLRIDGALGFLKTEYDEHVDRSLDGNKLQNSPAYTARLGISYQQPEGFYGRLEVRSRGDITFDDPENLKEDSYIVADLRAGYKFRNWDMYGYVNNIADKEYIYRASIGEIKNHVMFGPGRTIGVGVRYQF